MELTLDAKQWRERRGMARLLDALGAAEGRSRYVGGAARDSLLGLADNDVDVATQLRPDEVIERLQTAGIKAVPTGIEHGTVTAVSDGQVIEVTTLRRDVSTDGRRAVVAFTDDWQADAARRDFTINALSADPASGEIFDYFGGLDDLQVGIVRFIGDPLERIAEDHLRILRYFRFHARFGTAEPDQAALAACTARANDLMALSRERIADELLKLLGLPDPTATVALMVDRGILAPVLPEIGPDGIDRLRTLVDAERRAGIAAQAARRLAALLPADPGIADKVAARLKLSNKLRKRLAAALSPADSDQPQDLAYRFGTQAAGDRLLLAGRPDEACAIATWPVPRLPIGGGRLIERGVAEGPQVAKALRAIEQRWIAAGFPQGEAFDRIVDAALTEARQ
jgi:poly(A) polymerase